MESPDASSARTPSIDSNNNRGTGSIYDPIPCTMPSPAVVELDDWRMTLERLASDSSTWHQWNESNLYDQQVTGEEVVRRSEFRKQVSLDDLKTGLAQHEEQLQRAEAEDEELTQNIMSSMSADNMSLDELSDELTNLVSDLRPHHPSMSHHVDSLSGDTERLSLEDKYPGVGQEERRTGLHLRKTVRNESTDEKRC